MPQSTLMALMLHLSAHRHPVLMANVSTSPNSLALSSPSPLLQVSLGNLATLDAALAATGLALIATLVHHKVRHF